MASWGDGVSGVVRRVMEDETFGKGVEKSKGGELG